MMVVRFLGGGEGRMKFAGRMDESAQQSGGVCELYIYIHRYIHSAHLESDGVVSKKPRKIMINPAPR